VTYHADEQQLYGGALEEAGFSVVRLWDPDEALRIASAQRPTAVVTRILQPGHSMNGIELTGAIKSNPATAPMPVIIITSFSQSEYRQAAFAAGCDEFLLMPVLPNELVAAVTRAVNQAHPGEL
jgi:CheY-like chemotaxis protein